MSKRAFCRCCLLGLAEAGELAARPDSVVSRVYWISAGVIGYFGLIQLFGFPTFVSLFAYSQISLGHCWGQTHPGADQPRERPGPECRQAIAGAMRGEIEFRDVCFYVWGR